MTEHGKIHTDLSRSGGQPVTNDKSAVLTELRSAIREAGVKRNTPRLYTAVMAFDAALHQPTQSDGLRDAVIEECAKLAESNVLAYESGRTIANAIRALKENSPPESEGDQLHKVGGE